MSRTMGWYRVVKDLQDIDGDTLRGRATSIPPLLRDSTLLLVRRSNEPITQYVYGDGGDLHRAGELSGFKVEALADGEEPELPENATRMRHSLIPWRARLNGTKSMEKLRTDIHQIRRSIETILPEDSYLSVTFRERGFFENRRIRSWVADEGNAVEDMSDLVKSGSLLARVTVGCADGAAARDVVENASRTLFSDMSDMASHRSHPRVGLVVAGAAGAAAAAALALEVSWVPVWTPLLFVALGVYGVWRWWSRSVWDDIYQTPRHDWRWMARRRLANRSDQETRLGVRDKSLLVRAYPTQRTTLIVEPLGVMSLFMPVGTAQAVSQVSYPVPEVLSRRGIYLGRDESDRPAYIDVDVLFGGIAAFGEPGSGKSALSHGIMQWAEMHRHDTDPRIWGEDSRIISFDMKDDAGAEIMRRYERENGLDRTDGDTGRVGHATRAIYVADPNSVGLDFLGLMEGKGARETADNIARTMQYAFDDGAIMGNSLEVLTRALTIGVACERHMVRATDPKTGKTGREASRRAGGEEIAARVRRLEQNYPGAGRAQRCASVIGWALMAVGAKAGSDGSARALGQVCGAFAQETGERDWKEAEEAAEGLYGRPKAGTSSGTTVSRQSFTTNVNSSMNKLTQLASIEHVFTSRRGRVTWGMMLSHPGNYHIVIAPHLVTVRDAEGRERKVVRRLPEGMGKILGAWMMESLWTAISERCQGWQDMGKHTMIVCDELSMLATLDATIPSELKEQGRSLGVISVQCTQYGDLLPQKLLTSVLGYSTFAAFSIPAPEMARMVAERFGTSAGWTYESVSNLPKYWAAVRTRTDQQLQPTFTIKVHDFDHDFDEGSRH